MYMGGVMKTEMGMRRRKQIFRKGGRMEIIGTHVCTVYLLVLCGESEENLSDDRTVFKYTKE